MNKRREGEENSCAPKRLLRHWTHGYSEEGNR
jgi:hypothetical protein